VNEEERFGKIEGMIGLGGERRVHVGKNVSEVEDPDRKVKNKSSRRTGKRISSFGASRLDN